MIAQRCLSSFSRQDTRFRPLSTWRYFLLTPTALALAWIVLVVHAANSTAADGDQGKPAVPNPGALTAPGGGSIELEVTGGVVVAKSDYWRLKYDLGSGGILSSIVFPHGTGHNLLVQPFRTSVDQWADQFARPPRFTSSRHDNVVTLTFSGRLATPDREESPVSFETVWTLSPFFVRASHTLTFDHDLKVRSVGIASTAVRAELSEYGVRPSPVHDADPSKLEMARFGKLHDAGTVLIQETHAPINLFFFHRDVEGFDLTTASDLGAWEDGLTGTSGTGNFEAKLADDELSISVVREPLDTLVPVKVAKGAYQFAYYLGLPRIVEKGNRRWRHLSFGNHPWPSDADIKRWADNGVNLVRLHNDFAEDGNFWHDAAWPPYDERGMAEVRRIVATCHGYGILVVPYIGPNYFHPEATGYREHAQRWARTIDEAGTVLHDKVDNGEYGAQMCFQSGWLERLKSNVEKAYREFSFDGIYWDGVLPEACNNKLHNGRWHLGSDESVELLAWCRRLIGPKGVLIHHVYGPLNSITFENFADLVVNMEEIANSDDFLRLDEVPIMGVLAESLPRSPCPSYRSDRAAERSSNRIAQLVLLGMFPWADLDSGPTYKDTLQLFRAFKHYELEEYRFRSAYKGDVRTVFPDVRGAVYSGRQPNIVVIANLGGETHKSVAWTVRPEALGVSRSPIAILDVKTGASLSMLPSGLQDGSLHADDLGPYEYRLFEIRTGSED